jgi:GT2 family glycosyltransferase
MVDLSVVIVSWNTRELLRGCLWSVVSCQSSVVSSQSSPSMMPKTDNCKLKTEIIIVDNGSRDGSTDMVRVEFPTIKLIANAENLGFARANNQGIRASQGRYIVLLNSDTMVPPGALEGLVSFMAAHPAAGAVGPRLLRPDGTPQPFAFGGDPTISYLLRRGINRLLLRRPLHDWTTDAVQLVDWVSGACLMVRREAIDQAGLLDEKIFMYFEDNDWCLRIRQAGWQVYYNPQVAITHIGGQSVAQNPAARRAYRASLRYFYARHYGPAANLALQLLLPVYARLVA